MDYCTNLKPIISIIKTVLNIVRFAVPLVLIVIGTFDIFKAVVASKEEEIKAAQKLLIKRVVYAVIIFLIPTIVMLILNIVSNTKDTDGNNLTDENDFWSCWNNTGN
jgi:cell division protein FtsW (lipid II flippase)